MLLPKKTFLGHLKLYEVYDDYFGPKCFTVKNQFGQIYLVYWNGDDNNATQWLYVLVTESKLDLITQCSICIRKVFQEPEAGQVFGVTINQDGESNINVMGFLDEESLPPTEMYINPSSIVTHHPEAEWGFKVKIAKKNRKHEAPERKSVTKIIDSFSELLESLMKGINCGKRTEPRIYPLAASFGSFEVSLKTNDNEDAAVAIEQLYELLTSTEDLNHKLNNLGLDPYRLQELLEIIRDNHAVLKVTPKTNAYLEKPFDFGKAGLNELIDKLNSMNLTFIDSKKVPQANDIKRVINIVRKKALGEEVTYQNIEGISSDRQLKYHLHAAKCLGLLKDNYSISASGRFFSLIDTTDGQYSYLANQFESAEFGWCWMKWAKVSSITKLDPSTAADFVKESVNGLNEGTSERRATCLSSWLKLLQPFAQKYE